ncbi:MAG: hypothetical protein Q8891_08770 [Bacteroidota bacterium]|nr:hypothetical protein [Bacteroidota bacterium]
MKASIQQEILLITGTTFSSRQRWQQSDAENPINLPETEQLEQACWNGLLNQMLPEIAFQFLGNKKLYLWRVKENKSSLEIELGEYPHELDKYFSIAPNSFLSTQIMN